MEQVKVAKWGNSLAVRLPSRFVKAMGLKEGDFMPLETLTGGAAIRARLAVEREARRMTREEGLAVILKAREDFPKDIRPEDWKIDRNSPDMRG